MVVAALVAIGVVLLAVTLAFGALVLLVAVLLDVPRYLATGRHFVDLKWKKP